MILQNKFCDIFLNWTSKTDADCNRPMMDGQAERQRNKTTHISTFQIKDRWAQFNKSLWKFMLSWQKCVAFINPSYISFEFFPWRKVLGGDNYIDQLYWASNGSNNIAQSEPLKLSLSNSKEMSKT